VRGPFVGRLPRGFGLVARAVRARERR